jgi:hypothetical protein
LCRDRRDAPTDRNRQRVGVRPRRPTSARGRSSRGRRSRPAGRCRQVGSRRGWRRRIRPRHSRRRSPRRSKGRRPHSRTRGTCTRRRGRAARTAQARTSTRPDTDPVAGGSPGTRGSLRRPRIRSRARLAGSRSTAGGHSRQRRLTTGCRPRSWRRCSRHRCSTRPAGMSRRTRTRCPRTTVTADGLAAERPAWAARKACGQHLCLAGSTTDRSRPLAASARARRGGPGRSSRRGLGSSSAAADCVRTASSSGWLSEGRGERKGGKETVGGWPMSAFGPVSRAAGRARTAQSRARRSRASEVGGSDAGSRGSSGGTTRRGDPTVAPSLARGGQDRRDR